MRALPEKNRADVAPAVTHRAQDRDLLDLRKHRHGEDVEDAETGKENNQRDRDRGRDAQGEEELEVRFLAFLPAARFVLKKLLEMLRQFRRAIRIAQFVKIIDAGYGLCRRRLRDLGWQ